jgi:hypothetical protein
MNTSFTRRATALRTPWVMALAAGVLGGLLVACAPAFPEPPPTSTTEPPSTTTTTVPPLVRREPVKEWAFSEFRGDSVDEVQVDDGIQVGGPLQGFHDFGPTSRDSDTSPDTGFTDTGVLSIDFFGFTDVAESVAVTGAGDIIAGGLARANVDGYGVVRLTRL